MITLRCIKSDAVSYIHASIHEHRRETVVIFIRPCRIIKEIHAFIGVVLVEAFMKIAEGHTVFHNMRTNRLRESCAAARTAASEFESIAIAYWLAVSCITCMICPAAINYNWMVYHIQIPVVIRVCPCTTTVKLRTWTWKQFTCESIGITAVVCTVICPEVCIIICIAINNYISSAELISRIEFRFACRQILCLLNGKILIHAYLQTSIVVVAEYALLYYII